MPQQKAHDGHRQVCPMLSPGDLVPDFTLPVGYADGRKEPTRFSSLLGKGPIVISFFPLAFTSTCTKQMCDARDHADVYAQRHATLFGFSCDSVFSNAKFAAEHGLAHGIFSDANREVVDALWETYEVVGVKRVPRRGWMVVAPDGRVAERHVQDPGTPWVGHQSIEEAIRKVAPPA
jgi:glutaredoxin-dependent peroxiredoxin